LETDSHGRSRTELRTGGLFVKKLLNRKPDIGTRREQLANVDIPTQSSDSR
jgi:hypothetical protein